MGVFLFLIGVIIGCFIGMFGAALCAASSKFEHDYAEDINYSENKEVDNNELSD